MPASGHLEDWLRRHSLWEEDEDAEERNSLENLRDHSLSLLFLFSGSQDMDATNFLAFKR